MTGRFYGGQMQKLKKGCYRCWSMQYESPDYEYPDDGDYFYCDKRIDEPEETFKTWPANRKLKCLEDLPEGYPVEDWRTE